MNQFAGIIPARMGSTRFPGKPLVDIAGKTMIQRVYEQASKAQKLQKIVVATDSSEIFDEISQFGGNVLMTSPEHPTGLDRIMEATESLPGYTHFINIQGDEPFIDPRSIDGVAALLSSSPEVEVATAAVELKELSKYNNSHNVKVVFDKNFRALYFSRSPIPHGITSESQKCAYKHLGLYGYRQEALTKIKSLSPSPLEQSERLEQLRLLENGIDIYIHIGESDSLGVDTPEDLEEAKRLAASFDKGAESATPQG